jgi:aldehyde dehydrogenase (NAD+)
MKRFDPSSPAPRLRHFIEGRWVEGSGPGEENRNPATGELLNIVPRARAREVDAAVRAARRAYDGWRRVPAARRGEILLKAWEILRARKEDFARDMTREMGKVLVEARGDVQEALDTALYYAGEGRRLFGQTTPSELPDKFALSLRAPVGVCALITPWNFPMAIPSWKTLPALLCGNTVVLKPATLTPGSARNFVGALEEAGVPPGVVNLVYGAGEEAGKALLTHPEVDLVSFTGSSETGRRVAALCGRGLKRCSLELGGKNAQIVMDDADLELALEGALWGAFGTTGQRCTATSRFILHEKIYRRFVDAFVARARALTIGDGLDPAVRMGPLVSRAQVERVKTYVAIGRKKDGARLLTGGKELTGEPWRRGFFHEPTLFAGAPDMRIAQEEIFGPVAVAMKVKNFEEAVTVMNGTRYGLSGSIYTRDVNRALRAVREIHAGIVYINAPTIGAEVHLPFGGVKQTGNGHREAGAAALDVFSEWKAVYADYSGKLQKAQIDRVE